MYDRQPVIDGRLLRCLKFKSFGVHVATYNLENKDLNKSIFIKVDINQEKRRLIRSTRFRWAKRARAKSPIVTFLVIELNIYSMLIKYSGALFSQSLGKCLFMYLHSTRSQVSPFHGRRPGIFIPLIDYWKAIQQLQTQLI